MVNTFFVLLFGSIYRHFIFFANGYLFYLFRVVKNNAVQYRLLCKVVSCNLDQCYFHALML